MTSQDARVHSAAGMVRLLKTWGLMIAFAVGAIFPGLHILSPLLPYMVGVMLTITLLGMEVQQLRPQRLHILIIISNICIGLGFWAALRGAGYEQLAEAAFFAGITGEAASTPVVVSMLGGKSEFAAVGLVLSSVSASIAIPLLTPFILILPSGIEISRLEVFGAVVEQVAAMLLAPCIIAGLLRKLHPASKGWAARLSMFSLGLWLCCMAMVSATGVTRVQQAGAGWEQVAPIAAVVAVMCAVGFLLGRKIGGKSYALECGQCLGQKNATVGIYLSLCYASPLVFLGPTLYLLCQHIFNTWQMARKTSRA